MYDSDVMLTCNVMRLTNMDSALGHHGALIRGRDSPVNRLVYELTFLERRFTHVCQVSHGS